MNEKSLITPPSPTADASARAPAGTPTVHGTARDAAMPARRLPGFEFAPVHHQLHGPDRHTQHLGHFSGGVVVAQRCTFFI
jgi:hypothetical protein